MSVSEEVSRTRCKCTKKSAETDEPKTKVSCGNKSCPNKKGKRDDGDSSQKGAEDYDDDQETERASRKGCGKSTCPNRKKSRSADVPKDDAEIERTAKSESELAPTSEPEIDVAKDDEKPAGKSKKGCAKGTCPKRTKSPLKGGKGCNLNSCLKKRPENADDVPKMKKKKKKKTSRCSCKSSDNLSRRGLNTSSSNPVVKTKTTVYCSDEEDVSANESYCSCRSAPSERRRSRRTASTPQVQACACSRKAAESDGDDSGDDTDEGCACKSRRSSSSPQLKTCKNPSCPSKKVTYCTDDEDEESETCENVDCPLNKSNVGEKPHCLCKNASTGAVPMKSSASGTKRVTICTDEDPIDDNMQCECVGKSRSGRATSSALCLDTSTSTPQVVTCENATCAKKVTIAAAPDEECDETQSALGLDSATSTPQVKTCEISTCPKNVRSDECACSNAPKRSSMRITNASICCSCGRKIPLISEIGTTSSSLGGCCVCATSTSQIQGDGLIGEGCVCGQEKPDRCICGSSSKTSGCACINLDATTSSPQLGRCACATSTPKIPEILCCECRKKIADESRKCLCLDAATSSPSLKKRCACGTSTTSRPPDACVCSKTRIDSTSTSGIDTRPISITIYCGGSQNELKQTKSQCADAEGVAMVDTGTQCVCVEKSVGDSLDASTSPACRCTTEAAKSNMCCSCSNKPVEKVERVRCPAKSTSTNKISINCGAATDDVAPTKNSCCPCNKSKVAEQIKPCPARRADKATSYIQMRTCEISTCLGKTTVFCGGDTTEEENPAIAASQRTNDEPCDLLCVDAATSARLVGGKNGKKVKQDAGNNTLLTRNVVEGDFVRSVADKAGRNLRCSTVMTAFFGTSGTGDVFTDGIKGVADASVGDVISRGRKIQCSRELEECDRSFYTDAHSRIELSLTHPPVDVSNRMNSIGIQKTPMIDAYADVGSSKSRKIQCCRASVDGGDFDAGMICASKSVRFNTVGVQKTPLSDTSPCEPILSENAKPPTDQSYFYTVGVQQAPTIDFGAECTSVDFEPDSKEIGTAVSNTKIETPSEKPATPYTPSSYGSSADRNDELSCGSADKATNVSYLKSRKNKRKKRRHRRDETNGEETSLALKNQLGVNGARLKDFQIREKLRWNKKLSRGKSPSELLINCVDLEKQEPIVFENHIPKRSVSPYCCPRHGHSSSASTANKHSTLDQVPVDEEQNTNKRGYSPYRCPKHAPRVPSSASHKHNILDQKNLDEERAADLSSKLGVAYKCPKHRPDVEDKTIITYMPVNSPKIKSKKIQSQKFHLRDKSPMDILKTAAAILEGNRGL